MDFILYKMRPIELLPAIYEWAAKGRPVRHLYSPMFLRNPKSSHPLELRFHRSPVCLLPFLSTPDPILS